MESTDRTILARGLGWMIGWRFDGKRGSFNLWQGVIVITLVMLIGWCYIIYGKVSAAQVKVDLTYENTITLGISMTNMQHDVDRMLRAMMLPPRQRPVIHQGMIAETNTVDMAQQ